MGKLTSDILLKLYQQPIFESEKTEKDLNAETIKINLKEALNIAKNKIGENRDSSFQSIKQILDRIPTEAINKSNDDRTLQQIFYYMTDPNNIKIIDEYIKSQSESLDNIINQIEVDDGIKKIMSRNKEFVAKFNQSASMIVRFEKLHKIYKFELSQLDFETSILKSLRAVGTVLNLKNIGQPSSGKITKIGGIDQDIDPDFYEVETELGIKILPKNSIKKIIKNLGNVSNRMKSEHIEQIQNISTKSAESISRWYNWTSQTFGKIANNINKGNSVEIEDKIDAIKDFSSETNDIVFNITFNYKDEEVKLEPEIKKAEEKLDSTGRRGIREKKSILRRIKETLANAALPIVSNGEVSRPGDYYRLFNVLKTKRPDWMNTVLLNEVFKGNNDQYNRFKSNEDSEKTTESYQTDYLDACAFWAYVFIEDNYISDLNDKEATEYKKTLESIVLEKKKEIKNYYLSKEFNLGNFNSVRINPEIDLPLYKKVPLAITEEDKKKESGLRNMLTGLGSAALHFFGGGIDVDMSKVQSGAQFKEMDKKVFQGLNKFIKGTVGVIGGKESARKYEKGSNKLFRKKDTLKEDMLSPMDSPSTTLTSIEGPGQIFQTPNTMTTDMDIMSLVGPPKGSINKAKREKKKSKRNKKEKQYNSILDFKSFLKSK